MELATVYNSHTMNIEEPERRSRSKKVDYFALNDGADIASITGGEIRASDLVQPDDFPQDRTQSGPNPKRHCTTRQASPTSTGVLIQESVRPSSPGPQDPDADSLTIPAHFNLTKDKSPRQNQSSVWFFYKTTDIGEYKEKKSNRIKRNILVECLFPICSYSTTTKQVGNSTGNLLLHTVSHFKERKIQQLPKDIESEIQAKQVLDTKIPNSKGHRTIVHSLKMAPKNLAMVNKATMGFFITTDTPFLRIENQYFQILLRKACHMSIDQEFPHTLVHTRRQLAGAAIKWANILEEELKRELHDAPSISITMDIWSSMNNKHQFIGVLAHFYSKEGEYTERTIGFAEISLERHTGETICKELLKIFSQLGITEKICSVTGDSASNNLAALRKLEQSLANYCEVVNRTYEHPKLGLISGQFDASNCAPCLNHVLNLVSKAFLDTVTGVASIDIDREREPSFNLDATIEEPEEGEQHEIDSEGFLINPLSNWEDDAETEESNTIRKCQKLAVALKSINSLGKFFLLCGLKRSGKDEAINMGNILPPLDVKTRWNSTFELLSFLQKRKLQIDLFFNCTKDMERFVHFFDASKESRTVLDNIGHIPDATMNALNQLSISEDDWKVINSAILLLSPLNSLTKLFSMKVPLLNETLSTCYRLTDFFNVLLDLCNGTEISEKERKFVKRYTNNASFFEQIKLFNIRPLKPAIEKARNKLQKYYELYDENDLIHIASILDPRKKCKLLQDHIATAADNVMTDIRQVISIFDLTLFGPPGPRSRRRDINTSGRDDECYGELAGLMFDDYDSENEDYERKLTLLEEFDAYISEPLLRQKESWVYQSSKGFDILRYWKDQSCVYPKLFLLSKIVLTVPITSTSTERLFSISRAILSYRRQRLSPETIRSLILLKTNPSLLEKLCLQINNY